MSMTSEELKDALRSGARVTYKDYFNQKFHGTVEAVVYRCDKDKGKIVVSAELKDLKAPHSVIVAKPERLSLMEEEHEI